MKIWCEMKWNSRESFQQILAPQQQLHLVTLSYKFVNNLLSNAANKL